MPTLGGQYEMDDAFRRLARKHQSAYRAGVLNVLCDSYGNMLTEEDAREGLNFYDGYGVFQAVTKRYPEYKKQLYANMLRSEHIPFNIFIPFNTERALFCSTVASAIGVNPAKLISISIEYAPDPPAEYLGDKTSFDVFCECEDVRGDRFFLGIEVKYTERQYRIGKKEEQYCNDPQSSYNRISKRSGLYPVEVLETLKTDRFRQVWRNHLLAESVILGGKMNYKYYKSVILYPSGNKHISKVVSEYGDSLSKARADSFSGVTFEQYFSVIDSHATSSRAGEWVAWLRRRYIPMIEEV